MNVYGPGLEFATTIGGDARFDGSPGVNCHLRGP